MTLEAIRRSPLEGRALPDGARVRATALPSATRLLLRGGADVVGPVAAAFGVAPPTAPARLGERRRARRALARARRVAADRRRSARGSVCRSGGGFGRRVSHPGRCLASAGRDRARRARRGARCCRRACRSTSILSAFPSAWSTRTLLVKAEITLWRREETRSASRSRARSRPMSPMCWISRRGIRRWGRGAQRRRGPWVAYLSRSTITCSSSAGEILSRLV